MRKLLSTVMARHIGETITVDTAIQILRELFPDVSFPPERFGMVEYRGYRFQCERFSDALPELHQQHLQHYSETEAYMAGIPLKPNYDSLIEAEQAGYLIQFTSRHIESGVLVGNMRVKLSKSTHNGECFCTEDTFYVVPEHRGGFMAVRLWQFVESCVRSIEGVRGVLFDSKLSNGADKMAKYLKYKPISTRHIKLFY